MYFDFITLPPFTEMYDVTERWLSDKVKEHCGTNPKVHCVMQLH